MLFSQNIYSANSKCICFYMKDVPAGYVVLPDTSHIECSSSWEIDWGDGNTDYCSSRDTSFPRHLYSRKGNYTITIRGDFTSLSAVSAEKSPIITNSPSSGNPFLYRVSISSDLNIDRIGDYAFRQCNTLKYFGGFDIEDGEDESTTESARHILSIGISSFDGCYRLERCAWLYTAETIGARAFARCHSLIATPFGGQTFSLAQVATVGAEAFVDCGAIQSMTFGSSLANLGDRVFSGCSHLKKVFMFGPIPTAGTDVFSGVPRSCVVLAHESQPSWNAVNRWHGRMVEISHDWSSIYEYEENNEEIAITGCKGVDSNVVIPMTMGGVPVTSVSGFVGCENLKTVSLPESLNTLGDFAFSACPRLKAITIPSGVTTVGYGAFGNCANLKKVEFLGNCPAISGAGANNSHKPFENCPKASGLVPPYSSGWNLEQKMFGALPIEKKWSDIFDYTVSSMGKVTVTGYKGEQSNVAIAIPEEIEGCPVVQIADNAFSRKTWLVSVVIPASVNKIGAYAFDLCSNLREITFEGNAPQVGTFPFRGVNQNCKALVSETSYGWGTQIPGRWDTIVIDWDYETLFDYHVKENDEVAISQYKGTSARVIIPATIKGKSVTEIMSAAFGSNAYVRELRIEANLKKIGGGAFYGCVNLSSINLPSSIVEIEDLAFADTKISEMPMPSGLSDVAAKWIGAFRNMHALTKVSFPSGITGIPKSAFAGCSSLKEIDLPSGVNEIGEGAFADCHALQRIAIPPGVDEIPALCFSGCSSLEQIEAQHEMTIGEYAFDGCSRLKRFILPDTQERSIQFKTAAFRDCVRLERVLLPTGLDEIWDSTFANCSSLGVIIANGPVSYVGTDAFAGVNEECVVYINGSTDGWTLTDGKWNGLAVEYDYRDQFDYTIIDDEIRIDDVKAAFQGSFPNIIGGYPVTIIGDHACAAKSGLALENLPLYLKEIDDFAFAGTSVTTSWLDVPDTVVKIGERAFALVPEAMGNPFTLNFAGEMPACGKDAFGISGTTREIEVLVQGEPILD